MDTIADDKSLIWFISGAGGGIGSALINTILHHRACDYIVATHHKPVCSIHPRVHWLEMDCQKAPPDWRIGAQLPRAIDHLDYFVNCSGILSDDGRPPEKRHQALERARMSNSYQINAAAPILLFGEISHLLARATRPVAAFLSAQVGSIGDNQTGGWYSYRMAKAALNMGVKCLAIEASRWRTPAIVMAVHPGTTLSNLSKPFTRRRRPRPRPAMVTAARIYHLLANADAGSNGRFVTADGDALEW